jgi:hypothetical protein
MYKNEFKDAVKIMNLMKKILLFSLTFYIILSLLTGCQQKTLYFKGEGDYWEGSYISHQTSDSENGEFEFIYKGKGNVKDIVYKITSNTGESSGNINVKGKSFKDSKACSGCAVSNEDEEFNVVIKWDGKEDSFTLKK